MRWPETKSWLPGGSVEKRTDGATPSTTATTVTGTRPKAIPRSTTRRRFAIRGTGRRPGFAPCVSITRTRPSSDVLLRWYGAPSLEAPLQRANVRSRWQRGSQLSIQLHRLRRDVSAAPRAGVGVRLGACKPPTKFTWSSHDQGPLTRTVTPAHAPPDPTSNSWILLRKVPLASHRRDW